jgi:MFS family permease
MGKLASALYSIAVAVWVGSLLAIGYIAAPVLFAQLADRSLAGNLAGAMFTVMAWVGFVCGTYLILFLAFTKGWRAVKSLVFWIVLLMLGLTAVGYFGVQPIMVQLKADALPRYVMESALRDRFATLHGVASALYLAQSVLGIALVILQERGKGR